MLPEILALFGFVIVLTCIGLGPSMWMLARRAYPFWAAFAAAPTIGFAIVGLLGFPLYRYYAPVRVWAWPVTAVLLLFSLMLVLGTRRDHAQALRHGWKTCVAGSVALALLLGVRSIPLRVAGLNHAIFATNPADAFTVMTLAESARTVPWPTLSGGSDLSNAEGVRNLVRQSPTALFSARFLKYPIRMTSMVVLAYGAALFHIETYRFYYPFKVVSLALAVPLFLLWGWRLNLPRAWSGLLAVAFYLGFWSQMNLELDSISQVNALPLCLLLIFTVSGLLDRNEETKPRRDNHIIIALLFAALCCYYPEYLFLSACAGAVALLTVPGMAHVFRTGRELLLIGLLALGLLLVSGQLIYLARYQVFIAKWTATAGGGSSHPVMTLFADDFATTLFGIYPVSKFLALSQGLWLFRLALPLFVGLLVFLIARYVVHALRTPSHESKVLAAAITGGLLLYNLLALASGGYTAAKALIFLSPFLALALAAALHSGFPGGVAGLSGRAMGRGLFVLWILTQLGSGVFALSRECKSQTLLAWSAPVVEPKTQRYDLAKIDRYLREHPPQHLLVNVPPSKNWMFPLFCMFALQKYQPFFQSGLIYDNRKDSPRYFFQTIETVPDYVLVENGNDYVAEHGLGDRVAGSGKLRLYKITTSDLALFTQFNEPTFGFVAP